jgi:uncharacterized membrane protein
MKRKTKFKALYYHMKKCEEKIQLAVRELNRLGFIVCIETIVLYYWQVEIK